MTEPTSGELPMERADLGKLGLDCTRLGPTTLALHSVPALLDRAPPERLLADLIAELNRAEEAGITAAIEHALGSMACHGAIRAGDTLSNEEATALLRELDRVEDLEGGCPHGRPLVHSLAFDELERRLRR